jgi:tRNA threonylcarbamoyl adenosine modification protein YjeE
MTCVELPDEAATLAFANVFAPRIGLGQVLRLDGPLGAGKTTFTRGLVAALHGDVTTVASPTFTLLNRYDCRPPMIHIDAYRLSGPSDLAGLGFEDLLEDACAVIEWSDRVSAALGGLPGWSLRFAHADGRRTVTWDEVAGT